MFLPHPAHGHQAVENPNLVPKVLMTSRTHHQTNPEAHKAHRQPAIPKLEMEVDNFLVGPRISYLSKCAQYDPLVIATYISSVLQEWKLENAYGILASIEEEGQTVPTLIFGIPLPAMTDYAFSQTPYNLPVYAREDCIVLSNEFDTMWGAEPVRGGGVMFLDHVSVGVQGSLVAAGSFGGFLKSTVSPENIFGIMASHCAPGAELSSTICSPSSLEVTSRFDRIVKYTTLCPTEDPDRQPPRDGKQSEVRSMFDRFTFLESSTGSSFLRPVPPFNLTTGTFSGTSVGQIVAQRFDSQPNILARYDQWLMGLPGQPRGTFGAHPTWKSRLDFCIFSCYPSRYGGNIFDDVRVSEIGALYPEAVVDKVGRTTGSRRGLVNGYSVQHWHSSIETHEIAVMSKERGKMVFADTGDSGGCVFVKENGQYKAAGLLIGKNLETGFALVAPLAMVLEAAPGYEWA
ncbi:hypothetical protein HOY82DRAFT_607524 [Tuber indicum]|nr:hypothetical protein HOY82DRAFT_607524 [Tuber indicum]